MTTANAVLSRVIEKAKAKQADHEQAFKSLARQIAEGDSTIQPEAVIKSLEHWNKEYSELDAEVERLEQRIQLIELANKVPTLAARSEEIYSLLESAEADRARRIQAIEQEHEDITAPLVAESKTVKLGLDSARRAQASARAGCTDPALNQRLEIVNQRQRAANNALRGGPGAVRFNPEMVKMLATHNYGPGRGSPDSRMAMLSDRADDAIAGYHKQEMDLKAILAECEKEREFILDEMSRTI